MSNHITIELCEADRARLDSLIKIGAELIGRLPARINISEPDPNREKLEAIVANAKEQKTEEPAEQAAEAPQETAEALTPTEDTTPQEEKPTEAKDEPAPSVTFEQIREKCLHLCATEANKKAAVRSIINVYGAKVSDLKDQPEKWAEVWGKLTALEKEGTA